MKGGSGLQQQWLKIAVFLVFVVTTESFLVDITYVETAVAKGAGKTQLFYSILVYFDLI